MNTSQKIDGGTGTDILKVIGNSGIVINLAETGSSANQIKIINQDGGFQDATGAVVSGFEDVDASQSSGGMTIFGKDGVNMNTKGSSGIDIITGGSGLDTIKANRVMM